MLASLRKKAQDHLEELGMPTRKSENFRHIRFKKEYDRLAEPVDAPFTPVSDSYIVFVNGHYREHLSKWEGVEVSSLDEAIVTYGAYLNNRFLKSIKEESDPFVVKNGALHKKGVFVYLPPKTVMKHPLQIIYITNTEHPALIMPRLHFFAGANASCDLLTTHIHLSGDYFQNGVMDISLEEGARVSLTQLSLGHTGTMFDAVRAQLKRNSFFNATCVTNGSPCHRNDYRVALTQEGAEAHLNGVWQLEGHAEAHVNVLMEHHAPACRSRQLFKGVLNDFSRSSFDGKIYVKREAQQTDAFQRNNNLLLSEHAQAYCKPNLEIFADDVKASHGATIGQLSEDELFYIRTRGIDEGSAKKLLIKSFCQDVYDCIPGGINYAG